MYMSTVHDSLLSDHVQISGQSISRGESGPNDPQFNVNCDNQNPKDSFVSEPLSLNIPVCYQQGGETYYVSSQWQGQTDAPLRDLQHATLTNRKIIQNANFKFSRTEELSFENSRYHNYVTDSEICLPPSNNISGLQKSEINVRRLLKENVKQYAKVVNTLPAGGDSDDISCAMFRQMAASCGIHVEDPRSFSENFEEQKNPKALEDTSCNLKQSVVNRTENPFGDGLMNLDSDLQSMKLEYSAVEVSPKNSEVNVSSTWNPNWMNDSFYSKDDSYFSTSYNSKTTHSENGTTLNESSVDFEQDAGENATESVYISENESTNASTPNLCFTPVKDWSTNFLLDSSSSSSSPPNCDGLSMKMSTPLKSGIVARDRQANITNVSTQTDIIFSPSLDVIPKKEMSSQGNQTSVLLKDASVNTRQLCTCSDSETISPIGSSLPNTGNTKMTDNAWNPLDTDDLSKQLLVDQNLNPASCLTDNYFNEQFTDIVPSNILPSSLRNPYRDAYADYKTDYPDISTLANTPPSSPETLLSDSILYGSTLRHPDNNLYFTEPTLNANEIKLDVGLYCLVLDKLLRLYPGLAKSPQELQLLAKRQTVSLQFQKSLLNYTTAPSSSSPEEPRAITKTNPLSSSKDLASNKFLHNLSTTLSNDINYLSPEDSLLSVNNQCSSDVSDFRYVANPTYRKFQLPPLPAKSDWNSKQLSDVSPRNSQVDWGMGFNPAVTKHDLKDADKCEHTLVGSPKMIMKRVENAGWNPTLPISIAKTSNLKYQNPSPEDCLPGVVSNDFQTNNWQQIIRKKKRFPFATEQNKPNLPAKIDANTRKGNYERLVQVILERLPNTDRTKVDELIREVRRRKNGLGGLTMREIVLEAKSIQHEKTRIYGNTPAVKNENQCALCVEELQLKPQKQLECGHYFHEECIMAWVYRHKRSCPTCGQLVFFSEDYPKLA